MARWFTFRRFLVYSGYFIGAFSILIGLFISKYAWSLQSTIRRIEQSWIARGEDFSNATWFDKAGHAIFAGHEDVSEYNTIFWTKLAELEQTGHFDRSNLTTCPEGYQPEWAEANARFEKWGFVLYRTDYEGDEEEWTEVMKTVNSTIRTHLEIEATADGRECDPLLVRDRAVLEIIEDKDTLRDLGGDALRKLFRDRVDSKKVDASIKMGNWEHGWYRLGLGRGRKDTSLNLKGQQESNGLSLNLCLVYDQHARSMFNLHLSGLPATGPRDPWEPFLVALDGLWDLDRYMYKTTWAVGYAGSYGVALSILFNDFHGRTFVREMERAAPYLMMGGPTIDSSAPLYLRFLQLLLTPYHAVARPGRYPYHDRWQETKYPFVREDSHWKMPEGSQEAVRETVRELTEEQQQKLVEELTRVPDINELFYIPCFEPMEEGCFQMGNFWVRRPDSKAHATDVSTSADTT